MFFCVNEHGDSILYVTCEGFSFQLDQTNDLSLFFIFVGFNGDIKQPTLAM